MDLPFTHDQFLDVFSAYNEAVWPVALLLWLLTVAMLVLALSGRGNKRSARWIAIILVVHWAWSGFVYHLVYFRPINPAATIFGALFVIEAGLIGWRGLIVRQLNFGASAKGWFRIGLMFVVYALLYPALGLVFGLSYPRLPSFGVPCPTTILTVGALLMLPRSDARIVTLIPILWTAVGGSAAFVLGIQADLLLPVAGALMLAYVVLPSRPHSA
jgi:hypothetical protein